MSTIEYINETISKNINISRRDLSRRTCDKMDWRNEKGDLKTMSCRKALNALNEKGYIHLPEVRADWYFKKSSFPRPACAGREESENDLEDWFEFGQKKLNCSIEELGEIDVVPIGDRRSQGARIWNTLMEKYHYLGRGKACGAQIRYNIRSSKYGVLGGFCFSGAAWRVSARDKFIGWSDEERKEKLQYVICNSRFLIRPEVKVPNLASHVLAKCMKRLSGDWIKRYGYAPLIVETYIDDERYKGTCYRASNWIWVGQTEGRGRQDRENKFALTKKSVFVYCLRKDWRDSIGIKLPVRIPASAGGHDWAFEEFKFSEFGDKRLNERLIKLARDFMGHPGANIPEACKSLAGAKAAYRFFDNKRVNMEEILKSHYKETEKRVREHKIVLSVQDTTSLNYNGRTAMEGIGPINSRIGDRVTAVGLELHDTLAFTPEGVPLGLLDIQCWARADGEMGKKSKLRHQLPIEEKESFKWLKSYRAAAEVQKRCPEVKIISVGDRDADLYELFTETLSMPNAPGLLVRAARSRSRNTSEGWLWDIMPEASFSGEFMLHIPRNGSRKARNANIGLSFRQVELVPPVKKSKHGKHVIAWIVYMKELGPPLDIKEPIEWMLITTEPVLSFSDARERVEWYSKRWGIEVYHRTLKSGCRIEDRQLGTADSLESCLAIDMVIAWRTYYLVKQGRETPDIPCNVFFEDDEWKALMCFVNRTPIPPEEPPSLRDATRLVASIGGFLGRKSDGEPGNQTTWRGLERLEDITSMYKVFTKPANGELSKNPVCTVYCNSYG